VGNLRGIRGYLDDGEKKKKWCGEGMNTLLLLLLLLLLCDGVVVYPKKLKVKTGCVDQPKLLVPLLTGYHRNRTRQPNHTSPALWDTPTLVASLPFSFFSYHHTLLFNHFIYKQTTIHHFYHANSTLIKFYLSTLTLFITACLFMSSFHF